MANYIKLFSIFMLIVIIRSEAIPRPRSGSQMSQTDAQEIDPFILRRSEKEFSNFNQQAQQEDLDEDVLSIIRHPSLVTQDDFHRVGLSKDTRSGDERSDRYRSNMGRMQGQEERRAPDDRRM